MATKLNEDRATKVEEFQFHVIPKRTTWENFQNAVYDPDKQEFFGRTKRSWYQLLIFYGIFYTCLAALFAICTRGLLATLDDRAPKWQLETSLIGTNPGLGFRPISSETREGSLIWYNLKNACTTSKWVNLLDEFLLPYRVKQIGRNYRSCDFDEELGDGYVCVVDVDSFGPCTSGNNYGYNSTSPCVFLKLNKIFGWVPTYYTKGQEGMPSDLKETIENEAKDNRTAVWISCEGENPVDKERIGGFNYYPGRGFPGYYYPYVNTENYLSPLIAVQIMNVEPNAIVNIECRAWAGNINYSGSDKNREGSVHFEILVDDPRVT
ncbi:Na K-ATPase domain containing protein [Asbolus verrucosus]|uniref:Na K-ATPase domain containing protein n=1 Tax=Asbolus verrucosus TaxID=1661398 RepID=A0A482VC96_ASBVE|nr:Na K-ATPase domain containing protein [Asbolus verrucosus]